MLTISPIAVDKLIHPLLHGVQIRCMYLQLLACTDVAISQGCSYVCDDKSPQQISSTPDWLLKWQEQTIVIGGDNRFLNGSTLVNGLQTTRRFDFQLQQIVFAQNLSTPRW